ncbi:hypothetical protein [Agromyces sp. LHK192]|uniref:hypothetical protein n=1 Tax=Agromyces sp. LHK192 TaxID=2498704 RepID=UPI000FD743BD|nr:hypothetical protein [Agromyces sp. LHK192]
MPIVIQRTAAPVRRSPLALLVMSALVGIPLAGVVVAVTSDLIGGQFVIAWAIAAIVSAVVTLVVMWCLYPAVSVDLERGGLVRIRSTDVPIASITGVMRSISANGTAQYLHYRLRSGLGPSARVLVVGRPFRGLRLDEAQALRLLFERSGLPVSATGTSAEADLLRGDVHANLGAAELGREALLIELDHVIHGLGGPAPDAADSGPAATPAADAAATPGPSPAPDAASPAPGPGAGAGTAADAIPVLAPGQQQRLEELVAALEADDAEAERRIAAAPRGWAVLARVAGWTVVLACAAFFAVLGWGIVQGAVVGATAIEPSLLLWSTVVGLVALVVWAAAADARARALQALGARWLAEHPANAERGLPGPLLPAALDTANRLLAIGSYGGSTLGGLGLLVGIGMMATNDGDEMILALGVGLTVFGAIALGLSIWGFVAAHRRRLRVASRFASLAGRRGELAYGKV